MGTRILLICLLVGSACAQKVNNNIVKFDGIQLAHGEFGLHYERRLSDIVGLEAGGGITLQDYYWHTVRSVVGKDFLASKRISENKNGVAFRTTLRLYPSPNYDQPTRLFLGLAFQFKQYSWVSRYEDFRVEEVSPKVTASFAESRQTSDIQILFGQQHFLNANMLVEYYAGAVLRFQTLKGPKFDNWEDLTGLTKNHTESTTGPGLVFGLRLGFGF